MHRHFRMHHVTLKEIAAKTGLSIMGVSKALRDSHEISEATKEYVRKIAKQLGYQPNRIASILSSGKTRIIGVLLPNFYGHYWASILDSIGMELRANGYSMLPIRWSENFDTDIDDIKELLAFRPDGLIVSPRFTNGQSTKFYAKLASEGLKIVFLSSFHNIKGTSTVCSDETNGIKKAITYLSSKGHKNILYVGSSPYNKDDDPRLKGFINTVKTTTSGIERYDFIWTPLEKGGELIPKVINFLNKEKTFSAAICASDYLAMDIMIEIKRHKNTPNFFVAIGFGDVFSNPSYLKIPLTTISHNPKLMGTTAVKKILAMIENGAASEKILIPTELIIRAE